MISLHNVNYFHGMLCLTLFRGFFFSCSLTSVFFSSLAICYLEFKHSERTFLCVEALMGERIGKVILLLSNSHSYGSAMFLKYILFFSNKSGYSVCCY